MQYKYHGDRCNGYVTAGDQPGSRIVFAGPVEDCERVIAEIQEGLYEEFPASDSPPKKKRGRPKKVVPCPSPNPDASPQC